MEIDPGDLRATLLVTAVVVVAMVVASIGFATLSDNPIHPDTRLNATDAADSPNATGPVPLFAIEHEGGEPVVLSEIEIIIGPRSADRVLTEANNWTARDERFFYQVTIAGGPPDRERLTAGDRVVVISGSLSGETTTEPGLTYPLRIRVFHLPSQRNLLDQNVRIVVGE